MRRQFGTISVLGVLRLLKAIGLFVIVIKGKRGPAEGRLAAGNKKGEESGETLSVGYTRY
jgi:hypothetical protein